MVGQISSVPSLAAIRFVLEEIRMFFCLASVSVLLVRLAQAPGGRTDDGI